MHAIVPYILMWHCWYTVMLWRYLWKSRHVYIECHTWLDCIYSQGGVHNMIGLGVMHQIKALLWWYLIFIVVWCGRQLDSCMWSICELMTKWLIIVHSFQPYITVLFVVLTEHITYVLHDLEISNSYKISVTLFLIPK